MTIDFDTVEIEPSNDELITLAFAARDLDAGDTAHRFGDILIRKLADIFGVDDVDHTDGISLRVESPRNRSANAGHDDVLSRHIRLTGARHLRVRFSHGIVI